MITPSNVESPPRVRSPLRAVARAVLWPLRRFFDPRFGGVLDRVDFRAEQTLERLDVARSESATASATALEASASVEALMRSEIDARTEMTDLLGVSLSNLESRLAHEVAPTVQDVAERLRVIESATPTGLMRLAEGTVEDIDFGLATLLNYAASHRGFAAQADLWFNHPILVSYRPRQVLLEFVNERIAEMPYVFRALASLQAGASVVDVGAAESTVCLSLASMGYRGTAVDPRPIPFEHPLLRTVEGGVEELQGELFDAVVCLSTIEHVGLPAYGGERGDDDADRRAMAHLRDLTRPEGLLVLTAPLGTPQTTDFERTYDRAGIERLLDGWDPVDWTTIERQDQTTWIRIDDAEAADGRERVALVTARRA